MRFRAGRFPAGMLGKERGWLAADGHTPTGLPDHRKNRCRNKEKPSDSDGRHLLRFNLMGGWASVGHDPRVDRFLFFCVTLGAPAFQLVIIP
jgi:hypothetical protein